MSKDPMIQQRIIHQRLCASINARDKLIASLRNDTARAMASLKQVQADNKIVREQLQKSKAKLERIENIIRQGGVAAVQVVGTRQSLGLDMNLGRGLFRR